MTYLAKSLQKNIVNDIMKLGLEIISDNNVMISGIVCRKDSHNDKGKLVNDILKTEFKDYNFHIIDHSNKQLQHRNGSGLPTLK